MNAKKEVVKSTQKKYKEKILMTQVSKMVWSLT